MSGFFGLFFAVFGMLFVWCLVWLGRIWMIIPAVVGFPLVAPFAAAGLYEMSRRLQKGESFGWSEILTVMASQRKCEMGWMAFVTLFIFWVWMYRVRFWVAIVLQNASFSDLDGFFNIVLFTPEGWTFLAIGICVGAFLSAVLFYSDRCGHAHAARPGHRFRFRHDHVHSRRHRKPVGHAHLGGDHHGHHAVVAGSGVSGPDLHPANPWPHHMASLSAGRNTGRGVNYPAITVNSRVFVRREVKPSFALRIGSRRTNAAVDNPLFDPTEWLKTTAAGRKA